MTSGSSRSADRSDDANDSVSTPKVDPEVTAPIPGGVDKPKTKGATDVTNPEDNKQPQESKVDTNYIIRGDGQFVLDIVKKTLEVG